MNINCLNDKIANANNPLRPIILRAILNIYQNGNNQISAQMVKIECGFIENTISWNNRIPAICNAMRNSLDCGGRISGENRDFNGFTIAFGDNIEGYVVPQIKIKAETIKKESVPDSIKSNNNLKTSNEILANQKIEDLFNQLNWEKVKDKNRKKLLIIGCSDSKNTGGKISNSTNYFINEEIYSSLIANREERVKEYLQIIDIEPNYLIYKGNKSFIKRNNKTIPKDYFKHCMEQGLIMPAIERYSGRYYREIVKQLYKDKNQNANLHILIISGLYGVIEFRDSIIDYHLDIKKNPCWTNENNSIVHDTICNYIKTNQIDNEMVFYSLSQSGPNSYVNALKPREEWKNIWITHDQGDTSVKFLRDYFLPLL